MAQPLQLVTVQAYDVRLTVAIALGGKQHITNDHITVPYGSELVDTQWLFIPAAFIRQQDYAVDAEEFVDGLVCVAVPVRQPGTSGTRFMARV